MIKNGGNLEEIVYADDDEEYTPELRSFLLACDALINTVVESKTTFSPPAEVDRVNGMMFYLPVGQACTGDWEGKNDDYSVIAYWSPYSAQGNSNIFDPKWLYFKLKTTQTVGVKDNVDIPVWIYDGTNIVPFPYDQICNIGADVVFGDIIADDITAGTVSALNGDIAFLDVGKLEITNTGTITTSGFEIDKSRQWVGWPAVDANNNKIYRRSFHGTIAPGGDTQLVDWLNETGAIINITLKDTDLVTQMSHIVCNSFLNADLTSVSAPASEPLASFYVDSAKARTGLLATNKTSNTLTFVFTIEAFGNA